MKRPKTFRLDEIMCNRLASLADDLKTTETAIIELAFTEFYIRTRYGLPDHPATHSNTPRCCRPIGEQCPCESFVQAGIDITVQDCRASSCPYLVE